MIDHQANCILITGGSSGIGLALASRFLNLGSEVIICGRNQEKLDDAKVLHPALHTISCDVSKLEERINLFEKITQQFPHLNALVNNAGIQNRPGPLVNKQNWDLHRKEIAINLEAPMHLSMLFIPHLLKQKKSYLMNVSSGLAFCPLAFMPTYCATKAALHSFTMSLRYQLDKTSIKVIEVIPPAVNTDLGGKGLHDFGVPLDEFADHAINHITQENPEFGYGTSELARTASREQLDEHFRKLNESIG